MNAPKTAENGRLERAYNDPDVVMLTSGLAIIEAAKNHVAALQLRRTTWKLPYFTGLEDEIKTAMQDHLGLTPEAARMAATAVVLTNFSTMRTDARKLMVDLQTLEDLSADRRATLLRSLGYDEHYSAVAAKKAEALTEMLFKIKKNLTPEVRTELTTLGVNDGLIGRLIGYAEEFTKSRVQQTALKQSQKELTDGAIREFNRLYEKVIAICRVAQDEFKKDKAVKGQFSYTQTVNKLQQARKPKPEDTKA